jgi:hypothetical protein
MVNVFLNKHGIDPQRVCRDVAFCIEFGYTCEKDHIDTVKRVPYHK